MKTLRYLKTLVFCIVFVALFSGAAFAAVPLMPVEELVPGMRGIAKTVIIGDTIESFDIEILGVTGNEASGYSILVKAGGELLERSGGIAQGMSGSPVYIDGRLVGAVAFGRTFTDPHYCFLTPIEQMLKLTHSSVARPSEFLPKNTPLMADGFTRDGLEYLNELLAGQGLQAIGVGGSGSFSSTKELQPGSALGVSLVRGDVRIGSIGTVTWVGDDGELLAFGHPFMQRGDSNYFLDKAWIIASVPNLQSAFKVGNLGETVGTVVQDRSAGIAGKLGPGPKIIPLYVSVTDASRGVNGSSRVEIIEDDLLFPLMINAVTFNTTARVVDRNGGGTARFNFRIDGMGAKGEPIKIERENMYYADTGLLKMLNTELVEAGTLLTKNKFEKIDIYGVNVDIVFDDKAEVAEIIGVKPLQQELKAGETLEIDVDLQPFRAEKLTKRVKFVVPKQQQPGKMSLTVRGGSSLAWIQNLLRKQQEEGLPVAKQEQTKRTLKDFVDRINNADQNNELIVDLAAGPAGAAVNPEAAGSFGAMLEGSPAKQKTKVNFIVDGTKDIVVRVVK